MPNLRLQRSLALVVLVVAVFFATAYVKVLRLQQFAEQTQAETSAGKQTTTKKCKFSCSQQLIVEVAVVTKAPKWKRPMMITNFYFPPYKRSALDRPAVPRLRPPIGA